MKLAIVSNKLKELSLEELQLHLSAAQRVKTFYEPEDSPLGICKCPFCVLAETLHEADINATLSQSRCNHCTWMVLTGITCGTWLESYTDSPQLGWYDIRYSRSDIPVISKLREKRRAMLVDWIEILEVLIQEKGESK